MSRLYNTFGRRVYSRNLQNAYLKLVDPKLNVGTPAPALAGGDGGGRGGQAQAKSDDEKPFCGVELRALNASLSAAIGKAPDHATRARLEGAMDQISRILDPNFLPAASAAAASAGRGGALP